MTEQVDPVIRAVLDAFSGARLDTSVPFVEEPIYPADFKIRRPEDLVSPDGAPPNRCWACASTRWWRLPGPPSKARPWVCGTCHAPAVSEVEWHGGRS